MAVEVKMPQLGLTMEEGTVSKWVKQEGDAVKVGDVLLEITTDKLTSEVTAEAEGTLIKIVAQEGEDIPRKGAPGIYRRSRRAGWSSTRTGSTRTGSRSRGREKACRRNKSSSHRRRPRRLCCGNQSGTAGRQGNAD